MKRKKRKNLALLSVEPIKGQLTQRELLPGVWGQCEAEHRHRGDQHAGHDQVKEIVERASPDLDREGDVQVGIRTALVEHLMSLGRDS